MSRYKLTIDTDDADRARTLSGTLTDLLDPPPDAATLFENGHGWRVEAYFTDRPDEAGLRTFLETRSGPLGADLALVDVPDLNWVTISQEALPPVIAGRFTVFGSHDRAKVPRGTFAIEIDAGEAFGTAHHATTQGCLEALDLLTRRGIYSHVLDLGCGSGVLAIAAARALPHAVVKATDIDPIAVSVASANARANGCGQRIAFDVRAGLPPGTFALVLANILAAPLIELATSMRSAVLPGGALVLSGLLIGQAPQVIATYRSTGFALVRHRRIAGWSTLTLVRR